MTDADRPVLTVEEVAEMFGVSRWLVQQAARTGELPSIRLGRRLLFPRARILDLLAGRPDPGAAPAASGFPHAASSPSDHRLLRRA